MKEHIGKQKRFTLSLPKNVHEELVIMATESDTSIRGIVLKCLKVGILAINIEKIPGKELIIREFTDSDKNEVKETKLLLIS